MLIVHLLPPPCNCCFRQILDTEDELQEIKSDAVPSEVRDWLASTFTQQTRAKGRRSEEKPKFRSIVHAVQAGIFVERFGLASGVGWGGVDQGCSKGYFQSGR